LNNIIIKNGATIRFNKKLTATPNGVEYEMLKKDLKKHYNIKDLRSKSVDVEKENKNIILLPGIIENIEKETHLTPHLFENSFSVRPELNTPYSMGLPWN